MIDKIVFFFYVFMGMIVMDSYSCPSYVIRPQGALIDDDDAIILKGSIKSENTITPEIVNTYVSKTPNSLQIGFLASLGNINITIMDSAQNIIFDSAVYIQAGDCEIVDISKLKEGVYSIHISKEEGLLSGKFKICDPKKN